MIDGWIQTYTGRKFRPLAALPQDVDLLDIAHALALKCRFNGHCRDFYSVAEHSIRVSHCLESQGASPTIVLWGLMHDAAEAYLADLGGPIKRAFHVHHDDGRSESFDTAEDRLLGVIAEALHFQPVDYAAVREADLTLLVTEARDLLGPAPESWNMCQMPLPEKIIPVLPHQAEKAFIKRFKQLMS